MNGSPTNGAPLPGPTPSDRLRSAGHAPVRRSGGPARALRLLHLEDAESDHALAMAHLQRAGLQVDALRIETRGEFERALADRWDVVLSDYHLPGFTGLDALQMLRERCGGEPRLVPFIIVSGQIGEDTAVEAMRNGASDYLLKANLKRLAPAVEQAVSANRTYRARLAADRDLQASRRRLSELAQHLQTSVEAERAAIAREIHDDVGGSLTALKFELDWIRRHLHAPGMPQRPELDARMASALDTVTHAIESSQRIMQNLRPAILEQGLVAALQWMTSRFEKRTGIACALRIGAGIESGTGGSAPSWPAGVPLVAYRTAQEALTNIHKHACASRVGVDLSLIGGVLSLEISDDGRGLGEADLSKAQSFGIRGLHERASTVGGWVDLSSALTGEQGGVTGTTLILSVPMRPAADASAEADADAEPMDAETSAWTAL